MNVQQNIENINTGLIQHLKSYLLFLKQYIQETYYYKHFNRSLEHLNKINTKIELLKVDLLKELDLIVTRFESIISLVCGLHDPSDKLECVTELTSIYFLISSSEWCLNGVYFQEFSFYPKRGLLNCKQYDNVRKYYKMETTQQFKRRIIKQLNKGLRQLKQANNKITLLSKKVSKINKIKQPERFVLNCNTWINGIIENKYNELMNAEESFKSPVAVEEKERIIATLRKQV